MQIYFHMKVFRTKNVFQTKNFTKKLISYCIFFGEKKLFFITCLESFFKPGMQSPARGLKFCVAWAQVVCVNV